MKLAKVLTKGFVESDTDYAKRLSEHSGNWIGSGSIHDDSFGVTFVRRFATLGEAEACAAQFPESKVRAERCYSEEHTPYAEAYIVGNIPKSSIAKKLQLESMAGLLAFLGRIDGYVWSEPWRGHMTHAQFLELLENMSKKASESRSTAKMVKVVINRGDGAYRLSKEAYACLGFPWDGHGYSAYFDQRTAPELVACVKRLGAAASYRPGSLKIVSVPEGVDWKIEEDEDGKEVVREVSRCWF